MKTLLKSLKITLAFCVFFSVFYILILWVFAQVAGPNKGNAEVATLDGKVVGAANVGHLLWDKAKDFIERAFTVIFLATIVIWFLQSFDTRLDVVTSSEQSLLAMVGRWLAPIFAPLGFADWRCATALITGFIAKESVVSTLQILLGTAAVSTLFTAKAALSFLVFTLLYTPCVAAIAAIRRETGSALRAALIALSQCCIAWLAAFAVYQLALLL